MPRVCVYTGKISKSWNNVSHSVRRTKRIFRVNLHPKTLRDPKTGLIIKTRLSANAIRTMKKKWITRFLQDFWL